MNSMFSSFDALCAEFLGQTVNTAAVPSSNTVNTAKQEGNMESPPDARVKKQSRRTPPRRKTISVFSGFSGGICADFFGDECGAALPNCKSTTKANNTTPSSSESSTMNKVTTSKNKNKNVASPPTQNPKPGMWSCALALQPTFDGLSFFVKP
ncbi:hypothetical protein D8674_029258 [Pyrus ussuriensis x Pyrus communis]|uniref:Uncharacterized protein n=1 Tax=Pyrus ussuriensis x Pyrus communis TaxID=2448454 RepID=A0A5N5I3C3_9ROSA|nr:hypothetical protein D8674_029258 [Pyrus ussuriensis x Pyrus communis]